MKKTYTKKQITEAIMHWKKELEKMNESRNFDSMTQAKLPVEIEKNMNKILGHIYSFIKQVYEDDPAEFDVDYV